MTDKQIEAVRLLREADVQRERLTDMQKYLASHVANALAGFCEQSAAFAEAVLDKEADLAGCLRAMTLPGRGLGYKSDFEVYRMAAQYFGATDIVFSMSVTMPRSVNTGSSILTLRLEDFIK